VKARSELAASTLIVARRTAVGPTATVDFATALPRITDVKATGATRPDITVTSAQPLTSADGGFVVLFWSKSAGDQLTDSSWSFVLPPSTTAFKAPALPAELASSAPPDATTTGAGFFESDLVPGFAQFKTSILPVSGAPPFVDERGFLPSNGTARITLHNSLDLVIP
jgi:hypothetical protein